MCAIVVHESVVLFDRKTGKWYGPDETIDTETKLAESTMELAAVARAPMDRVTSVVWLPNGLHNGDTPLDRIVASPDAEAMARAIEETMPRILSASGEPTSPWLGGYVAAALGPKQKIPESLRRLLSAIESGLNRRMGDSPIVAYGHEISIADLLDPSFLLPALAVASHEDWGLASSRKDVGTGFTVKLAPDPTALLGYRLVGIHPATPFTVMAPIVATATRCKEGDEYYFDDIVSQFSRWLHKNGRDAKVLDDVEVRIASSG